MTTSNEDREMLTVAEAAERFGVTERTIRSYIANGSVTLLARRVRASQVKAADHAARGRRAAGQFQPAPTLSDAAVAFAVERKLTPEQETLIRSFARFATRYIAPGSS